MGRSAIFLIPPLKRWAVAGRSFTPFFFRASVARVGGAEPTNLFVGLKSVVIRLQSARVDLSAK